VVSISLFDRQRPRASAIVRSLVPLLDHAEVLDPDDVRSDRNDVCAAPSIAIVGFGALDDAEFDIVRLLGRRGSDVIVYADGWRQAPLALRCAGLLAGTGDVVDTSGPQFVPELTKRLTTAIGRHRARHVEQQQLIETMTRLGIIGASRQMLALGRGLVKIGPLSDLPVLVTGETGTGKELVAHAIHDLDPRRRSGPFVPVNCGALSATLAESELFGHRKGAFTGALQDRRGLVRAAHGGTLFLDEISDLEPGLQGKLLRVLQEHRVRGVGDDSEEAVSVRVLAATNRDLSAMVDQGRFRIDLFYRINLLTMRVPPLSERRDDVERLVVHFVRKYGNGRALQVAPSLVAALRTIALPGNVRQLENLIRHAVVEAKEDGMLGIEQLPESVWDQVSKAASAGAVDVAGQDWAAVLETNAWNLSKSLLTCERQFLKAALVRAQGNQSATARLLGVTPRSIYNKIRKHRLAG
jgi:transcriptional regulator with PAS, ATPase and Fis domain